MENLIFMPFSGVAFTILSLLGFAILITGRFWKPNMSGMHTNGWRFGPAIIETLAPGDGRKECSLMKRSYTTSRRNCCAPSRRVMWCSRRRATNPRGAEGVDLVAVVGYYGLVSMVLNVDRYPLPPYIQPELKPLP